jgi:hypothetical protein
MRLGFTDSQFLETLNTMRDRGTPPDIALTDTRLANRFEEIANGAEPTKVATTTYDDQPAASWYRSRV